jgi:hypothetical protein
MTIESRSSREADRQRALEIIRELAAQGHALSYIAKALDIRGVPTLCGRPGARWRHQRIGELARQYGIAIGFGRSSHAGAPGTTPAPQNPSVPL